MIATHYQIDFSEHYPADYLATRGIGFLFWDNRFRGFESSFPLDHAPVDIGVGVRWLRKTQGVDTSRRRSSPMSPRPAGGAHRLDGRRGGRRNDPVATDPDLDLFDERNGPPYSPEFVARYRSAQAARNHAITDWAESELKRVRAAGFSDRPSP